MERKSSPRGPQDAPRRPWSQVAARSWFRSHFGIFLKLLKALKIVLPCWRGANFAKIAPRAREPQIDPKTTPKSSPKPPPEASKRLKLSIQDGASFLSKFQLKFERFWDPKLAPKITQNLLWRQLGASWRPPGPPGPLRRPPGGLRRAIFELRMLQNLVKNMAY